MIRGNEIGLTAADVEDERDNFPSGHQLAAPCALLDFRRTTLSNHWDISVSNLAEARSFEVGNTRLKVGKIAGRVRLSDACRSKNSLANLAAVLSRP
jgi:hypothetical protein